MQVLNNILCYCYNILRVSKYNYQEDSIIIVCYIKNQMSIQILIKMILKIYNFILKISL